MKLQKEVQEMLQRANLTEEDVRHVKAENLVRLIPKVLELLSSNVKNAEMLVLDVGCGDGTFAYSLKSIFRTSVVGLDCDIDLLKRAERKGVDVLKLDLEHPNFPFADKSFSHAICIEVLEHLFNPYLCLQEVARILIHQLFYAPARAKHVW